MNTTSYPTWVTQRLLRFLNTVRSAEAIQHYPHLRNDPQRGNADGYVIGEKVAHNIMQMRRNGGFRPFRSVADVLAVSGLGKDKLNDLLFSFSIPADTAVERQLFEQVLQENWELRLQSIQYESPLEFAKIADNRDHYRAAVAKLYAQQRFPTNPAAQRQLEIRVQTAQLTTYVDAHLGAFQFAFWWYLFDYDNWFEYELMRTVCEKYLTYHGTNDQAMQFRTLQLNGYAAVTEFRQELLIPTVVNFAEQKITVWGAQLND